MPEIPVRYGLVMVETDAFISANDGIQHYSTSRKEGAVHFAALEASTKEEALKEARDAVDYHGGIVHVSNRGGLMGQPDDYVVYHKWSHLFLVENVTALPCEEWAKEAEDEFWRAQAEEKECAERAEYERLREKFDGHQET